MTLADLLPAVAEIAAHPVIHDLRRITYLLTYPSILAVGKTAGPLTPEKFNQLAAMAYGWMPRIVRIDQQHIPSALEALAVAQTATATTIHTTNIADIAACIRSVVGASKLLHFVNNTVFPIWDSNIEGFRLGGEPPYNHMGQVDNYFSYADEVHTILNDPEFPMFFTDIVDVLNARLSALRIGPYPISPVRAVETAAFELAS